MVGHTVFRALVHCWPPLPGKAIKAALFYFTQTSVSVFLFSTSEQRLFQQHYIILRQPWTWDLEPFVAVLHLDKYLDTCPQGTEY